MKSKASPSMSKHRLRDAFDQFERYGGVDDLLLDALETLTDVNDDIVHDRHPDLILDGIEHAKAQLDLLAAKHRKPDEPPPPASS